MIYEENLDFRGKLKYFVYVIRKIRIVNNEIFLRFAIFTPIQFKNRFCSFEYKKVEGPVKRWFQVDPKCKMS